jgi:hypothetical protein
MHQCRRGQPFLRIHARQLLHREKPIGAIVGGTVGALLIVCLLVTLYIASNKQKAAATNRPIQRITNSGRDDQDVSSSLNGPLHTATNASSNQPRLLHKNQPPPHLNPTINATPIHASSPQPQYTVNYKDQARSVTPQQLQQRSVQADVPLAMAMEVSAASDGSRPTRAEPPGRQFLEM